MQSKGAEHRFFRQSQEANCWSRTSSGSAGTSSDRGAAVRSQFPTVGVMVLFTISGFWILSKIPLMM